MGSIQRSPELLPVETIRHRKWAPRSKTGCLTCRTRRIKCDEAKPTCRQCIKSRVKCRGLLYANVPSHQGRILEEIEPPSWELLQSIKYFIANVASSFDDGQRLVNSWLGSPYRQLCFMTLVITDRIERASKARGRQLQPWQDAAFAGLWGTFTRYIVEHVHHVNQLLENDEKNSREIFSAIQLLITFDMVTQNTSWQAHMNGYLTYTESLGGVKKLLSLPNPPTNAFKIHISACIGTNTTSPTTNQFMAIYRLSDEDIEAAMSSVYGDSAFGCPPRVLMAIFHISKLRLRALDTVAVKQQGRFKTVQSIAQELDDVDADAWARERLGDIPEAAALATVSRIMVVAVRLYGILALPKSCGAAWLSTTSRNVTGFGTQNPLDIYNEVRIRHRERLLGLLRDAGDQLFEPKLFPKFLWSIGWPLLVAGVASTNSSKETHEFITETLIKLSRGPVAPFCIITAVEKLRSYWHLEHTEWDECFSEPFILYV